MLPNNFPYLLRDTGSFSANDFGDIGLIFTLVLTFNFFLSLPHPFLSLALSPRPFLGSVFLSSSRPVPIGRAAGARALPLRPHPQPDSVLGL